MPLKRHRETVEVLGMLERALDEMTDAIEILRQEVVRSNDEATTRLAEPVERGD